jgi:hypothetical protein
MTWLALVMTAVGISVAGVVAVIMLMRWLTRGMT